MKNADQPIHPVKIHESESIEEYKLLGLTKREQFAMAAMESIIKTTSLHSHCINESQRAAFISLVSVGYADALLKQLEK